MARARARQECGHVLKPFRCDGRVMRVGEILSPTQVAGLRRDNKAALQDCGFVRFLPMSVEIGAVGT
jgi:hypothetical protein